MRRIGFRIFPTAPVSRVTTDPATPGTVLEKLLTGNRRLADRNPNSNLLILTGVGVEQIHTNGTLTIQRTMPNV